MDYDDDEPMYNSDIDSADSAHDLATNHDEQNSKEKDYKILNQDEVMAELNSIAEDTSIIIDFSPAICKILLHSFHWNKEDLLAKFYENTVRDEKTDRDAFLHQYHVLQPKTEGESQSIAKDAICQICFDESKLAGLTCGHKFCSNCWKTYLSVKIVDECLWLVPCPGLKCSGILDEDIIQRLAPSEQALRAYQKLVVNSFVQSSTNLKWCPGTDCGHVAKVPHSGCRAIVCSNCPTVFCFACGNEWHEPVDCEMLKRWLKKCSDDSETSNWLHANTKDCPQCHVTIEKDGGCNHMTCKNTSCRFEFCWTCLGPWKPHGSGWYSCNRFDDTDAKKARDEQERSRAALQRYLHYYNRFTNHKNSLKLEKKLRAQIQDKMLKMQQQEYSWIETQYLKKAVDVLNECRRTLMYTYAFAFYLEKSNQTTIFEDNQQNLELATEHLSELLETDLDTFDRDSLKIWKQNVQDKFRYVAKRRTDLLDHVYEGNTKKEWKFNTNI